MSPLSVLIVEDNQNTCRNFSSYAETLDEIQIIGVANTANEAVQLIHDYLPHAVILDLELHQGGGSGLDVLQGIRDAALSRDPFVLICTVNTSNTIYEYARSLGADYILYKHQEGYSEQYVLDFLRNLKETINNRNNQTYTPETPYQYEQRIRKRITSELYLVGVQPNMKGFSYLVDAIELFITEPQHCLCDTIADKYGKTKSSVERAMQNAIDKAWKTTDIDELLLHFKAKIRSDKGVPSITEFVCYYADKIKSEY